KIADLVVAKFPHHRPVGAERLAGALRAAAPESERDHGVAALQEFSRLEAIDRHGGIEPGEELTDLGRIMRGSRPWNVRPAGLNECHVVGEARQDVGNPALPEGRVDGPYAVHVSTAAHLVLPGVSLIRGQARAPNGPYAPGPRRAPRP